MTEPLPGDFALSKITGIGGMAISVGQFLIGDAAPVQHAYVYVGNGQIVQAMPGGAELVDIGQAATPYIWSSERYPLTDEQRNAICQAALSLVGTPYSWLDYASIGLAAYRVRPAWVRDYVASTGHQICSQLTDDTWRRGGVHLFDDGRIPGDVSPGDLWKLLK